jgi:hypothetical protein
VNNASRLIVVTALVAVFSAGLTANVRETLASLGAWRLLPKPASMDVLRGCVADSIALKKLP